VRRLFFGLGKELPQQNRGLTVQIPEDWTVEYMVSSVVTAGYCTYIELNSGKLDWYDMRDMMSMIELNSWLEWEQHKMAQTEAERNKR